MEEIFRSIVPDFKPVTRKKLGEAETFSRGRKRVSLVAFETNLLSSYGSVSERDFVIGIQEGKRFFGVLNQRKLFPVRPS